MAKGNAALLDELDHAFEDIFAVGVEAQDEAAHHLDAVLLDQLDAVQEIAARVLHLVVGDQAQLVGRLNAEEDRGEAGVLHQLQQLQVVGQVQRGFGDKAEGTTMRLAPLRHRGQQLLGAALVADEVVVHHKDRIAPACLLQLVQLGQHLRDRLGARLAAIDLDDVAELAVKRAPARVLHGHGAVALHLDKAEIGQRADVHGWAFRRLVHRLGCCRRRGPAQGRRLRSRPRR